MEIDIHLETHFGFMISCYRFYSSAKYFMQNSSSVEHLNFNNYYIRVFIQILICLNLNGANDTSISLDFSQT